MQVVINIPENTYKQIQALARNGYFEHDICGNSMRRIANGTPLPKGHGRLVDANAVYGQISKMIDSTQTIIEADRSEEV